MGLEVSGARNKDRILSKLKLLVPVLYFAVLSVAVWGKALFGYGFVLKGLLKSMRLNPQILSDQKIDSNVLIYKLIT